jgi:glyoxylase-like metal-dependent hydrolase (beta-lactamase superfamily II)
MIEELLKDIFIIKVPLPNNPLKNINCYLIKGRERNLLIDTAFNTELCYVALKSGLDELNVNMQNTDLFLTHQHSDHTGLAALIATDKSKIYMSEIDRKGYINLLKPEYWNLINDEFLSFGFSQEELDENKNKNPMSTYLSSKRREITGINEGFEIDLGNYKFKGIYTPGHTPGHMCLYDEEHKILFGGDHIIFDITPNITSWIDTDNSLGLYIESLNKIKKLDIKYTFSAHRQAMGNCHERVKELIHHHEDRFKEAYEIVKNSNGITTYDVASKMTWSIRAKNWSEFPISQKWFAVGEASAHLEFLFFEGAIIKELRDGIYFYKTVA